MSRAYRSADAEALWELKQGFERGLGEETGSQEKAEQYRDKLDEAYRADYLEWVDRCVAEQPRSVQVAVRDGDVIGYVFVLPDSLAYIWDAAVLNEIFVHPDYRGTGVGDELMEAAISLGREQDLPLDRMVLDVDRANRRAQAFYERYGFTYWGEMQSREL